MTRDTQVEPAAIERTRAVLPDDGPGARGVL